MQARVVELRRLRERTANLAAMQAGARAAAARAEVDAMDQAIEAARQSLSTDIARFNHAADTSVHMGRWFNNASGHFDQRRVEIERMKAVREELEAAWQACREELAECRRVLAAAQARREQMEDLARRTALRERAQVEGRREATMAELIAARARRTRQSQSLQTLPDAGGGFMTPHRGPDRSSFAGASTGIVARATGAPRHRPPVSPEISATDANRSFSR